MKMPRHRLPSLLPGARALWRTPLLCGAAGLAYVMFLSTLWTNRASHSPVLGSQEADAEKNIVTFLGKLRDKYSTEIVTLP